MVLSLSPGVLYGALDLLFLLNQSPVRGRGIAGVLSQLGKLPPEIALEFTLDAQLVKIDADDQLTLSESGQRLLADGSATHQLRIALLEYVTHACPPWAELTVRGREETRAGLGRNARQCLADAELFVSPPPPQVVDWWDRVANQFRNLEELERIELGRRGEQLSIKRERDRVGIEPEWVSFESNLAGYDLLSILSAEDHTPLSVEVKATTRNIDYGYFYLTRNEWKVAQLSQHYAFHLWSLGTVTHFAELSVDDVIPHIPIQQGGGIWETVKIAMKAYRENFVEFPIPES